MKKLVKAREAIDNQVTAVEAVPTIDSSSNIYLTWTLRKAYGHFTTRPFVEWSQELSIDWNLPSTASTQLNTPDYVNNMM